MSLYTQASDAAFDPPLASDGAGHSHWANRVFAGVCGWIILCVAGGAVLGQKGAAIDHAAPAGAHSAALAPRTPI